MNSPYCNTCLWDFRPGQSQTWLPQRLSSLEISDLEIYYLWRLKNEGPDQHAPLFKAYMQKTGFLMIQFKAQVGSCDDLDCQEMHVLVGLSCTCRFMCSEKNFTSV